MYFILHTFYAAHPALQVLTFLHSDLQGGKLVQAISAFFGGFIIAFTKGWLLTLVMLTSLPLVAIAGAVSAQLLTGVSSKRLTSYSDAADTV